MFRARSDQQWASHYLWAATPWALLAALLGGLALLVVTTHRHRLGLMLVAIALVALALGGFIAWLIATDRRRGVSGKTVAKVRIDWEGFERAFRDYVRRSENSAQAERPQPPDGSG